MRLKPVGEQVVVVVGASSGIGRATATALAARGAKVVVAARSADDLEEVVNEIRAQGGDAVAVPTDVSRYEEVERLASAAVDAFGRIDSWVHLAAITLYARLAETTPDEFRRVVEVDLLGQAHGAMAALPWLRREGRGALIHVASVEALRALPYQSAYAAAKHGVKGMVEALRMELQHDGVPISVTNVMPSSIATPAFERARTKLGVQPRGIPPLYDPEIVVRAILRAVERPTREVVVGTSGRLLAFVQALSPRLTDLILRPIAFWTQRTDRAKAPGAADALDRPSSVPARVRGAVGAPWWAPASAAAVAVAALVAVLGILGWRRRARG